MNANQGFFSSLWSRLQSFLQEMTELMEVTKRSRTEVSLEEQILDAKADISLSRNDQERAYAERRVNDLCIKLIDFAETEGEIAFALMQTQPGSSAELYAQQKLNQFRNALPE